MRALSKRISAPGVKAAPALYDADTPPVGIFALRDAVRCLRETGRFVDEEGEATNALSDLLDRLADGVPAAPKWCPECRSAGVVGIEQDVCPTCDGTGKVASRVGVPQTPKENDRG